MRFQTKLAILISQTTHFFLTKVLRRNASALPGKLALGVDPNLLAELRQKFDLVIVTGTNGKTLTTALCAKILNDADFTVITNPSGSNMIQGITGTLIEQLPKLKNQNAKPIAVLEVDEANVEKVAIALKPKYFLLTNIFRDQMDRYGEVYTTYKKIVAGINAVPEATVIANGDSPIFQREKLKNPQIFYGFKDPHPDRDLPAPNNTDGILSPFDNSILHYHYITYANLGDYFSLEYNFKRPKLKYQVTEITKLTPKFSDFSIDDHPLKIEIGGLYNIYNALAAYSLARELGIKEKSISDTFAKNQQIFGRQEAIKVEDKEITIVLIKNPVGANTVIDMILTEEENFSLIVLLNANYADGIDTSWIWDAEFEKLQNSKNLKEVSVGGQRYRDIKVRLKMAEILKDDNNVFPDINDLIEAIKKMPTKKVYIAATYTAMLQLRQNLAKSGYIKGGF